MEYLEIHKVSIIMSCLNTPDKLLSQSVESILNQTYRNIEFIIVNNGGNNLEQLTEFQKSDSRISIINNNITQELPVALNQALQACTGDYIARMDSDDISLPNRIKRQVVFFEKHPEISVCSMYVKKFGNQNGLSVYPFTHYKDVKATLFVSNEINHPTVMFRKSFLNKFNIEYSSGYNYSEDFEMWNRCSRYGNFAIIPRVGLLYRMHDSSASKAGRNIQADSKKKVLKTNLLTSFGIDGEMDFEALWLISEKKIANQKDRQLTVNFVDNILKLNQQLKAFDLNSFEKVMNIKLFSACKYVRNYYDLIRYYFLKIEKIMVATLDLCATMMLFRNRR